MASVRLDTRDLTVEAAWVDGAAAQHQLVGAQPHEAFGQALEIKLGRKIGKVRSRLLSLPCTQTTHIHTHTR